MDKLKQFIIKCLEYARAHMALTVILAACAFAVFLLAVVLIVRGVKKKKEAEIKRLKAENAAKRKALEKQKAQAEEQAQEQLKAAKLAQARAEEAERARAAAEEKAQAEKAAREEAEALAQAELTARAEAETRALEEKAARAEAEVKALEEKEARAKAEVKALQEKAARAEAEAKALAEKAARAEAESKMKTEKAKAKAEKAKAKAEEVRAQTNAEIAKTSTSASAEQSAPAATKKTLKKKAEEQKPAEKKTAKPSKKKSPVKVSDKELIDELKDGLDGVDFYEEDENDQAARYSGKWVICRIIFSDSVHEDEEMYFFELHASNGEKLLSSEEYTSYNGVLRGIETHKTNILKGNFKITLSKKGDYIFKLLSGKNMLLCMGENYPTRARCESAIESTKRFAKTAILDENIQDQVVKIPPEDDSEIAPLPDGYNGKWIIDSAKDANGETVYYFELFANNGEKLLSSEEYTTYVGAVNGIQTHKNNISKNNFRISLTKRGDYIYKLLNSNNQLLCLGEHYKTKRLCQNAVESVKRFAMNSPVLADSSLTEH